ncbi:3187_t:CDS:2, partial [Gigaspora rosea]
IPLAGVIIHHIDSFAINSSYLVWVLGLLGLLVSGIVGAVLAGVSLDVVPGVVSAWNSLARLLACWLSLIWRSSV